MIVTSIDEMVAAMVSSFALSMAERPTSLPWYVKYECQW